MRSATLIVLLLALTGAGPHADPLGDPARKAAIARIGEVTAEKLRELPVDNLTEAIRTKAGIVVAADGLQFRCGCARQAVTFEVNSAAREAPAVAAAARGTALDAVAAMFDALERRSYAEYTAWLAPDFLFTSNDSIFRATHRGGMSLEDEREFARNLLRDEAIPVPPGTLPCARTIHLSRGLMRELAAPPGDTTARITIDGLRAIIELSDGSEFDTGEARHELWLVRGAEGWRVRRWTESIENAPAPAPDTSAVAAAATDTTAAAGTRTPGATSAALPARLDLYAIDAAEHGALQFNVALPRAGGVLEMFDVQGRRVERRDLGAMRAGYHRVSLDGGSIASGVYWARLRQNSASVTARVVWVR